MSKDNGMAPLGGASGIIPVFFREFFGTLVSYRSLGVLTGNLIMPYIEKPLLGSIRSPMLKSGLSRTLVFQGSVASSQAFGKLWGELEFDVASKFDGGSKKSPSTY